MEPAVLEDGFCAAAARSDKKDWKERQLNTQTMKCAHLMEFVYIARDKVRQELLALKANLTEATPARDATHAVSRASSLLSAHMHISGALASQRSECFSEHIRLLIVVNLRRLKGLASRQVRALWDLLKGADAAASPAEEQKEVAVAAAAWAQEAVELFEADLKTLKNVLATWTPPTMEEARYYSHEVDGRFSTMEVLRRDTFEEWTADKGLLRGLLRHVFPKDAVVADLGAGTGHYARWLNETGLVTAVAFDGAPDIELVSRGAVATANLGRELRLWRTFDWALCLEVAEHIPPTLTRVFLRNLEALATTGVILSWATPDALGMGHANPKREEEVLQLVALHAGSLRYDPVLTMRLRAAATVPYIRNTVMVLKKGDLTSPADGAAAEETCDAQTASCVAPSSGCLSEKDWVYAGNDVMMYNEVPTAMNCCELCSQHEACRYWTWSEVESHKQLCWIKSSREYRVFQAGFVSGARRVAV